MSFYLMLIFPKLYEGHLRSCSEFSKKPSFIVIFRAFGSLFRLGILTPPPQGFPVCLPTFFNTSLRMNASNITSEYISGDPVYYRVRFIPKMYLEVWGLCWSCWIKAEPRFTDFPGDSTTPRPPLPPATEPPLLSPPTLQSLMKQPSLILSDSIVGGIQLGCEIPEEQSRGKWG